MWIKNKLMTLNWAPTYSIWNQ